MKKTLLLLGLLLSCAARADVQTYALTLGTSSGPGTPAGLGPPAGQFPGSATLYYINNESTTASIACRFATQSQGTPTAALNTAGDITIAPGGEKWFILTNLGNGYVSCIASAGSTPATVMMQ